MHIIIPILKKKLEHFSISNSSSANCIEVLFMIDYLIIFYKIWGVFLFIAVFVFYAIFTFVFMRRITANAEANIAFFSAEKTTSRFCSL